MQDREAEPRFSNPTPRGGGFAGGYGGGGYGGGYGGSMQQGGGGAGGRQLYVSNLPYTVGWQDLKDLFRQASKSRHFVCSHCNKFTRTNSSPTTATVGNIVRADVHTGPDGRPKGSGIVIFDNPDDARNAIQQFNGYEWQGRALEVREDRYAGMQQGGPGGFGGRGGFGGGFAGRGGFGRGGFGGGRGGFGGGYGGGGRGGFSGGYGGGASAAAAGYDPNGPSNPPNSFTDYATSGGERSPIIYVRNVSSRCSLRFMHMLTCSSSLGRPRMMTSLTSSRQLAW